MSKPERPAGPLPAAPDQTAPTEPGALGPGSVGPESVGPGSVLGRLARHLAERASHSPRVQETTADLRARARHLREGVLERADERLETLIESRRGAALPGEVGDALAQRRQQREERQARLAAREAVLAVATTPEERRVLGRVLQGSAFAGGEDPLPRYTELLDLLAPGGQPAQELAIHRAIWALAERQVLSVSPHGVISAVWNPAQSGPERHPLASGAQPPGEHHEQEVAATATVQTSHARPND